MLYYRLTFYNDTTRESRQVVVRTRNAATARTTHKTRTGERITDVRRAAPRRNA
jgi:hypothetical protein